jgi:site-specific recombinase XerD
MDCLLPSRLIQRLAFLEQTSKSQLITYLCLLQARNYAQTTLEAIVVAVHSLVLALPDHRKSALANNLTQTTSSDIDGLIAAARSRGLAAATINGHLSMLKEFFDFLREDGQMPSQPVIRRRHRLLAPMTLPKPIAEADLMAFFKVIDSIRDRLIFLLMLRCGLRVSEACSLTWTDVDLEAASIRINSGKGQVDRVVYIAPDVEKALQLWQAHGTPSPYLFPSRRRRTAPLGRGVVHWQMKKYLRLAGVQANYSPHGLRHTFATQLLNAGVSLEVLKELMGHRSIQMTLRYTKLYEATKRQQYDQAMERIENRQFKIGGE